MDNSPRNKYTAKKVITVKTKNVVCPAIDQPVLFEHPRMYLEIQHDLVTCPYCETTYQLHKETNDE